MVGREKETWRALEIQEFECEQKKMNKLLSQITFTNNKEKRNQLPELFTPYYR